MVWDSIDEIKTKTDQKRFKMKASRISTTLRSKLFIQGNKPTEGAVELCTNHILTAVSRLSISDKLSYRSATDQM